MQEQLPDARRGAPAGCPFFGLLFFGQAKKSRSFPAEGTETSRRPRQRRKKEQGHWIPATAGNTNRVTDLEFQGPKAPTPLNPH